ncbi:hypothetical protein SADUNF_Sadunf08G0138400 [Salix dunnii]|uniref:COP1-interacting protein 7 n=1 Tax=Salix dunnii TaxID=1413687 RepID=A0A835MY56_9ROSI|nr:hypothetical protein SADUNF_Sadunf08G0138400 [Salix dunnii]
MKSSTRLDSAIFQLTPTRTRCDLIIRVNEKIEKVASGLVQPFLDHLKTAQDQVARGGYSIILEPESDASWFTKGTVERFVRFVSTPEVLERVYNLESEILQIEKGIAIQSNNDIGLSSVESHQAKPEERIEGSKPLTDSSEEKAIVLYKPGSHPHEANGSTMQEGNSKSTCQTAVIQITKFNSQNAKKFVVKEYVAHILEIIIIVDDEWLDYTLIKVMETRKTLLQKEQGMAFARAVAAGFDIDQMAHLISFAECFGALRLMDACVRFMELWKRKHETGQWVEIEGAEAMSSRSDFFSMNASGIVLSNTINKQWPETPDGKRKAGADPSAVSWVLERNTTDTDLKKSLKEWKSLKTDLNLTLHLKRTTDYERPPTDQQPSPGQQEYFQGQFPHPMFPPWPIHSPPGTVPVFPGYPMQGIPYYQNYPGNSPVFQPPYSSGEDPKINASQRMSHRRHSMDSSTEPKAWEVDALRTRSQDETEEKETSGGREPLRKGSHSGKRQSGTVVIRNINYITSKRQDGSGSESQSVSGSENDEEDEVLLNTTPNAKHRNSLRSSKSMGSHKKTVDKLKLSDVTRTSYGKEDDGGHWKAFQNYLLKDADEAEHAVDQGMDAMEKNVQAKRRQNVMGDDPLVNGGRDPGDIQERDVTDTQKISGNWTCMTNASKDESLISRKMGQPNDGTRFANGQMDLQSAEIDGRRCRYRMNANDDFGILGRENKPGYRSSSSYPLAVNGFETAKNDLDRRASNNMDDDSYVVSLRSTSLDQVVTEGRNIIDVDSEFPSPAQKTKNLSNSVGSQVKYEPDDLTLMPERGTEKGSIGFDPALDYGMQVSLHKNNKEMVTGQGSKKSDKYCKPKLIPDTSERKKKVGPIRKGKPSKLSPLDEARARADKLRTFKADLQKIKKEKEEEEIKRLEALKLERQKRIAARGSSTTAQPASQPTRKQLPTKLSPSSHRGSKFSDSEPGSSSPLQRFPIKTVSAGSGDSRKVSRSSKLSTGPSTAGNRLTLSLSSLSEQKNEKSGVTPDSKASMARIRRLSEPKVRSSNHASIKPQNTGPVLKPKLSSGTESKKISAIMYHDKSKAASLPELKTKTPKGQDFAPGNSSVKEIPQKMHESKAIATSESAELKQNGNKISHHSDEDDNLIIEKTVVVLECEKPSIPYQHTSEHKIEVQDGYSNNYKIGEKTETLVDCAAIRASVSPLTMDGIGRKHTDHQLPKHPGPHEAASVYASHAEKESAKLTSTIGERAHSTSYARVSSLEYSRTGNSEYGKASPSSLKTDSAGTDTIKPYVSDLKSSKLEEIPEALEKPHTKESLKGFRQLLKFGRKSHTAGKRNAEINHVSLNGSKTDDNAASSSRGKSNYTSAPAFSE